MNSLLKEVTKHLESNRSLFPFLFKHASANMVVGLMEARPEAGLSVPQACKEVEHWARHKDSIEHIKKYQTQKTGRYIER